MVGKQHLFVRVCVVVSLNGASLEALRYRATKGHSVDALAPGGDEGRGTLRKAMGSREQALIHGYPNGATPPQGDRMLNT